jgi:hypothetical protein
LKARLGNQASAQQLDAPAASASQQIGAVHQEIAGLKSTLQQMHTQHIEQELKYGFDLETAYKRAELLRPDTAAQTRTTSAQTRTPDKSISPGGVAPSNGASRTEKKVGRREALENAMKRVSGGL